MLDTQGRITLGKKLCEEASMPNGTKVVFALQTGDSYTYRIVPIDDLVNNDALADCESHMINKYRLSIPKSIRNNYTRHAILTYSKEDGFVYIHFLKLREFDE